MLRRALPISTAITRAVRTQPQRLYSFRVRPVSRLETVTPFIRFNSTAPNVQSQQKLDWDAPKLSYEQVRTRSEQPSPDAYLIDVREPDEVIQGSIPSAVNLPLSTLKESLNLNPVSFKEKHGFEKPKSDQELVFYCRSGKRSASACDLAKKKGYTNIFNYEGSWLDWSGRQQGSQ